MRESKYRIDPEPSMSDVCMNCGHERRDHQGKHNRGSCAKCWDVRSKWAAHCQRFRQYTRHLAPNGEPLRGYYPGVECEHGYDACPTCDGVLVAPSEHGRDGE